jgi:pyruvate dehydrogenase E2 component (dihydrolipoamide acetyltransferase)
MPDFLLPDLGEGLTEADIIAWHVKVGDDVAIDQIVVEVETAKAAVEVPVPFAGVVEALHAKAGETITVGAPLITVATATAAKAEPAPIGLQEPGIVVGQSATDEEAEQGSGNVLIGYGTPATKARRRRVRSRPGQEAAPAAAVIETGSRIESNAVAVISPLVRKMARDARVNLATITGSGPAGMVTRGDVEQAIARATDSQPTATATPAATTRTDIDAETQRIPLKGLRKVVADKLSRSRREIPEATVWVDVDATAMLATRAELNERDPQRPISVLALLARFAVVGLRLYPELNGRVEGDEIVLPSAVHLGFAAQTERGLVVPVVHNAHRLSTRDLSAAMSGHTSTARGGGLSPSDLTGGTFTINNYGVFGVDGSAAIINHPEVAILGVGRLIEKPWVVDGAIVARRILTLSLVFDHRVCDGGYASGFLRKVIAAIEHPVGS